LCDFVNPWIAEFCGVPNFLASEIQERKELLKGSYKDRHYNAGSILLGFGVLEAVGGGLNTWIRTGKLFPGPHLFGGAGKSFKFAFDDENK